MKICHYFLLLIFLSATVFAQVSINSFGSAYTQDFNSLGTSGTWTNNSTITGWYSSQSEYLAGPPATPNATAGFYSFGSGTATDRALGAIPNTTTGTIYYGVSMQNNTGTEIRSFTITYTGEQWRARSNNTQTISFEYQVAASTPPINGTTGYTGVGSLNFTSPITAIQTVIDPPSQVAFNNVVINVVVPAGEEIMFRWADAASGNTNGEHGLGIDDVSITAWPEDDGLPVELSSFNAVNGDGKVTLKWVTESEINNMQFDILRALSSEGEYLTIGIVEGQFNTNQRTEYSFIDKAVSNGTTYWYKLVDVDITGIRTEHGPISATPQAAGAELTTINSNAPSKFRLYAAYPNPFNPATNLKFDVPASSKGLSNIKVEIFNTLGQKVRGLLNASVSAGTYQVSWDGTNDYGQVVPGGIYFAVMSTDFSREAVKLVLVK